MQEKQKDCWITVTEKQNIIWSWENIKKKLKHYLEKHFGGTSPFHLGEKYSYEWEITNCKWIQNRRKLQVQNLYIVEELHTGEVKAEENLKENVLGPINKSSRYVFQVFEWFDAWDFLRLFEQWNTLFIFIIRAHTTHYMFIMCVFTLPLVRRDNYHKTAGNTFESLFWCGY